MTPRGRKKATSAAPDAPSDPEARVQAVMRAMTGGTWSRALAKGLAESWGVDESTVRHAAAEAARRIRAAGTFDVDELLATILGRLDRVYEAAMGADDHKAAVAAVKALADVAGIAAPIKIAMTDVSGNDAAPPMPPEVQRLMDSDAAVRFFALHEWLPRGPIGEELIAGRRDPFAPCGREVCAFCARIYQRPALPAGKPA